MSKCKHDWRLRRLEQMPGGKYTRPMGYICHKCRKIIYSLEGQLIIDGGLPKGDEL